MSEMSRLFQTYRLHELELSRRTLSDYMIEQAVHTATAANFKWVTTPDAPNTYDDLRAAYEHSRKTGEPLPVSSKHNEDVIYTSAEANTAFRFLHDVHHVLFRLSFQVVDELDLAIWHLTELEREGFRPDSLPWKMLHADLIGQAQLIAVAGQFPNDQRRFVDRCLLGGFEAGLIAEAREIGRGSGQR